MNLFGSDEKKALKFVVENKDWSGTLSVFVRAGCITNTESRICSQYIEDLRGIVQDIGITNLAQATATDVMNFASRVVPDADPKKAKSAWRQRSDKIDDILHKVKRCDRDDDEICDEAEKIFEVATAIDAITQVFG